MPVEAPNPPYIDHFVYTVADARAAVSRRTAFQRNNEDLSPIFRNPNLSDVEMLVPILDRLEHELDCTILFGCDPESNVVTPVAWYTDGSGASIENRTVAIVRNAFIETTWHELPELPVPATYPAVMGRRSEPVPEGYKPFRLSRGVEAGLIGPAFISMPWWYANSETTPEQLESIYASLGAAVVTALDPDQWDDMEAMYTNQLTQSVFEIINSRSSSELNQLRNAVPNLIDEIATHERAIASKTTRLNEIKVQLEAIEKSAIDGAAVEATVARELKVIKDHPEVIDIRVDPESRRSQRLQVFTSSLPLSNIDDPSMSTVGGAYRIDMTFGASPMLRVHNLTRRIGSYDHPHVSEGNFCLGDQRRLADELLARCDIAAAVSFVIDLLKQVNPNDTYTREWEAWFQLPESDDE